MVVARRADVEVPLQLAVKQHRPAGFALGPEVLRHLAAGEERVDLRADVVGDPVHAASSARRRSTRRHRRIQLTDANPRKEPRSRPRRRPCRSPHPTTPVPQRRHVPAAARRRFAAAPMRRPAPGHPAPEHLRKARHPGRRGRHPTPAPAIPAPPLWQFASSPDRGVRSARMATTTGRGPPLDTAQRTHPERDTGVTVPAAALTGPGRGGSPPSPAPAEPHPPPAPAGRPAPCRRA